MASCKTHNMQRNLRSPFNLGLKQTDQKKNKIIKSNLKQYVTPGLCGCWIIQISNPAYTVVQ